MILNLNQNQNAAANSKRFSRNGVALTAGTPFAINHKLKNNEITVRVFDKLVSSLRNY